MSYLEILDTPPRGAGIQHALFDFDGTVSLIREGWERVMAPVMCEAIAPGEPPTPEIEAEVLEYIDESTGIQTILQMEHLVEMVRAHGKVPPDRILDAQGYKDIYIGRLHEVIRDTVEALEAGTEDPAAHRVPGSLEFIQRLRDRAVTLYVASGTDQPDVRREAACVGIAPLIDGGIFGALRTYQDFSKESFIRELFERHQLSGPELAVFGDGPVEIRLARAAGAIAVGVAASPARDSKPDPARRARLIRAGAHLIVPDFSDLPALEGFLWGS
ncbi:MAG: HAD family hydrolase [Armatimonadetes bacterium]|jgi:phosphoglycolate phosphatase-like HAD superfamily hydrolase|nr:HAD family hydrolase [Armatimonadota bacterium]MDI9602230.1 HAD family hydrolase [Acidobacteriota bacterium]